MAGQHTIDWSFFSMARYLLAADPADSARPVFSRRGRVHLRQVTWLQRC